MEMGRPDSVMASVRTDTIILMELADPWEDRMKQSNTLKEDYSKPTMDLIDKGLRMHFFTTKVAAQGLVGRSSYSEKLACHAEKEAR